MQTQSGFTAMSVAEFENWLPGVTVARTITFIQQHHTWLPNYAGFHGDNHFTMQRNMKHHHVSNNGWSDIGQHFTIFPDGMILTGRPLNNAPACIFGNNAKALCIESVGDFDIGQNQMTAAQRDSILRVTAAMLRRFSMIPRNDRGIVYHHWFDLNTGARLNGGGSSKSCPGTAFFGGNTLAAFNANFLPAVLAVMGGAAPVAAPVVIAPDGLRYVEVTADSLNIRTGPGTSFAMVSDHGPAQLGSVLRVFDAQDDWFKVSNSKDHWVSGRRTAPVTPGTVNTVDSNGRSGPGQAFNVSKVYQTGEKLFIRQTTDGWHRVEADIWVHQSLITLD